MTSIVGRAFLDCSGLTSFFVDEGNSNYKSVNGLLLTKDGIALVAGVNGDIVIPPRRYEYRGICVSRSQWPYECRSNVSRRLMRPFPSAKGYMHRKSSTNSGISSRSS